MPSFALVGNERLVAHIERLFIGNKGAAPFLSCLRHRVCCFHPDQELPLAIQDSVDVEEDVVHYITSDDAVLFQRLLQIVQMLKILNIFAFGVDELTHDVIAIAHLRTRLYRIVFRVRLDLKQEAALLREIENMIDDRGDLNKGACQFG